MKQLRIGILGTRGIPNYYGGFERAASYLASGFADQGHAVFVYNSSTHPYQLDHWNKISIIHAYNPEWLGAPGQFIYDLNCLRHARKAHYDIILVMGYTSSSIWLSIIPPDCVIVTNMDGLEWKRSKYSKPVQKFLNYAESLAVKQSTCCVADSQGIKAYLDKKYLIHSKYIPYGASLENQLDVEIMPMLKIAQHDYYLLIARIEPENNIKMILEGFHISSTNKKLVVVGQIGNAFAKKIFNCYKTDKRIIFAGAIFFEDKLYTLRRNCIMYFHGHTVGGTNPSLLEAMAAKAVIAAHDNNFNKEVLGEAAFYFNSSHQVLELISLQHLPNVAQIMINRNLDKICSQYNWNLVVESYTLLFTNLMANKGK